MKSMEKWSIRKSTGRGETKKEKSLERQTLALDERGKFNYVYKGRSTPHQKNKKKYNKSLVSGRKGWRAWVKDRKGEKSPQTPRKGDQLGLERGDGQKATQIERVGWGLLWGKKETSKKTVSV